MSILFALSGALAHKLYVSSQVDASSQTSVSALQQDIDVLQNENDILDDTITTLEAVNVSVNADLVAARAALLAMEGGDSSALESQIAELEVGAEVLQLSIDELEAEKIVLSNALAAAVASNYSSGLFVRGANLTHVDGEGGLNRHEFGYLESSDHLLAADYKSEYELLCVHGSGISETLATDLLNMIPNTENSAQNVVSPDGHVVQLKPYNLLANRGDGWYNNAIWISHRHRDRRSVLPTDRTKSVGFLIEFQDDGQLENLRTNMVIRGLQHYDSLSTTFDAYNSIVPVSCQWIRKNVLYVQASETTYTGFANYYPAVVLSCIEEVAVKLLSVSMVNATQFMSYSHSYSPTSDFSLKHVHKVREASQ